MKANEDIRTMFKENNVKSWQVAEQIGISEWYFSRLMRKELSNELKKKVTDAVLILSKSASIQVYEKVIRCSECIFFEKDEEEDGIGYCHVDDGYAIPRPVSVIDFCSSAKQRGAER